ncbi:LutB/LldF family L-lactate oxidation iron-sulfur protein [Helicobacter sp. 11S03491-1]|uniref:LutB/LldF family L-lactate oxidation iron-sulfur protein n=1 Tax=Helicobacter sp. 11S03491-1 TaxID=1476196 RepID=UPI000BA66232|nr:LutB/LldF family L-lactate oxidation iron-sulfur protein [Helicobacter sp. 11S03491-1]PAF41825.1 iron-sulfur cluster-binding protein [Helicobacter sp. 11S03491-1]
MSAIEEQYESIIHEKIHDKQLRMNLKAGLNAIQKARKKFLKTKFKDWKALCKQGEEVKKKALGKLDILLKNFEENAGKNGMKIHWANDAKEANEIICKLAKQHQVTKILKGKSMASEEIHLNHYLKQNGITPIETDLGEFIVQLLEEPPVHILAPAAHKNRYEIGEIFKEKLHVPLESEPEKLNNIARNYLRKEFENFKMGISGVNFALAKEGVIWLVENEGNGRMCTTACDIHVAICGIEKVIENFEDASILASLLNASAVASPISTYANIISSPRKEGEKDGPKEVHVVLLNNNRSKMLGDSKTYTALSCIRCGACLNHCPVYDKIGGHAYLSVYSGPIGEVISSWIFNSKNYEYLSNLCSLCGRCSEVCPVDIPLADLIRDLRNTKVREALQDPKHAPSSYKKEFFIMREFAKAATSPKKWRFILRVLGVFRNFIPLACFFPPLKQWVRYRTPPIINSNIYKKMKNHKGIIYEH